jgi:hypothetical protein
MLVAGMIPSSGVLRSCDGRDMDGSGAGIYGGFVGLSWEGPWGCPWAGSTAMGWWWGRREWTWVVQKWMWCEAAALAAAHPLPCFAALLACRPAQEPHPSMSILPLTSLLLSRFPTHACLPDKQKLPFHFTSIHYPYVPSFTSLAGLWPLMSR